MPTGTCVHTHYASAPGKTFRRGFPLQQLQPTTCQLPSQHRVGGRGGAKRKGWEGGVLEAIFLPPCPMLQPLLTNLQGICGGVGRVGHV